MQREIKFRVFDKEAKTMQKVSSIDLENNEVFIYDIGGFDKNLSFDEIELMQFTGLTDKNGVEIYEGDIVCQGQVLLGHICITGRYGVSVKMEGASCHLINYVFDSDFDIGELSNIEIIGNIHKNPELLK